MEHCTRTHELKLDVKYFDAVYNRVKNFEIRFNDRDYRVADTLILKEFNSETKEFTGRMCIREVDYISDYAQQDGYVVMSLG